jgi:hypothetical protein
MSEDVKRRVDALLGDLELAPEERRPEARDAALEPGT